MMSIKGLNYVANLRKMRIYNPNVDLVNDNAYTKLLNYGCTSVAILRKMEIYNTNVDLVNDSVYTKFS